MGRTSRRSSTLPTRRSSSRARAKDPCSSTSRPTACPVPSSATRRSTARRKTATRPRGTIRSCASASASRSATTSSTRSTRRLTRSSTRRSSSRRTAPTRSRKTHSRTSMPEITYREAVRDALGKALRTDDDVFIMGEDIAEMGGSMAVTQGLLEEFGPERVRNTPISEMAIVGAGIGAAMAGMRPVVEIMYEDFLTLSLEQIVNQAAKHRYMPAGQLTGPLTNPTQGGAGWAPGAQHAQQLEAWLVHVPGLKVAYPSTPEDVRGLLWTSIYDDNPVIFFEHRLL